MHKTMHFLRKKINIALWFSLIRNLIIYPKCSRKTTPGSVWNLKFLTYLWASPHKPWPGLLNWGRQILLNLRYVVERRILTQAAWKNIVPFSRYLNFTRGTITKIVRFSWFFVIIISHQKYIRLTWNFYHTYISRWCTYHKKVSSNEWTVDEMISTIRGPTKWSFSVFCACTYFMNGSR